MSLKRPFGYNMFQIFNGPVFKLLINGNGAVPKLEKSFTKHYFGPCFLYKPCMRAKTVTLTLTNRDTRDIGYLLLGPCCKWRVIMYTISSLIKHQKIITCIANIQQV